MSILNKAKHLITEARERIDLAEQVYDSLRGTRTSTYRVKEYDHGFVMVDDGQDRWLSSSEDYSAALYQVVQGVIDDKIEEDDAYERLCDKCGCLYSRNGSGDYNDDLSGLRVLIEDSRVADADEIFADLGIEVAEIEDDDE